MPVRTAGGTRQWQRRERGRQLLTWLAWLVGTAVFVFCWEVISRDTMWVFVWDAPAQGADLLGRMIPPRWSYLPRLWWPLWDTMNIATLGTVLAIVLAVPVAFLAARNTTPSVAVVRPVALFVIVASRSINALIWALLLVSIIGPGVLAGILSIMLRSVGFVAKLLYEAIEEIDRAPVEAVTATGAGRAQVVAYGIVPQATPAFAGISVFRWDINIRESTVLGLVGAGGIGFALNEAILGLEWSRVGTILLIVLAVVVASEAGSAWLRRRLT
jgi:phosphonate transport system permease protein